MLPLNQNVYLRYKQTNQKSVFLMFLIFSLNRKFLQVVMKKKLKINTLNFCISDIVKNKWLKFYRCLCFDEKVKVQNIRFTI